MKTILVPYDFSEASENALHYAAHLSKYFAGKIILFHTFHVPAYTDENSMLVINQMDLLDKNKTDLDAVKEKLCNDLGGIIEVETLVREGFLLDSLEGVCEEQHVDIIVSGIKSDVGFLKEYIFGSNSIEIAKRSKYPVLIVPEMAKYKKIQKIGFAYDYEHNRDGVLDVQAKYFKVVFNSELLMVNVMKMVEEISEEKAKSISKVENSLSHTAHQTVFVNSDDVVEGLIDVINDRELDILVVHPHKHSLIEKFVHKSVTTHISFKSPVPILVLHESKK